MWCRGQNRRNTTKTSPPLHNTLQPLHYALYTILTCRGMRKLLIMVSTWLTLARAPIALRVHRERKRERESTKECSTENYKTVQYRQSHWSNVQCSTVQCRAIQHIIYDMVWSGIVWGGVTSHHSKAQCSTSHHITTQSTA